MLKIISSSHTLPESGQSVVGSDLIETGWGICPLNDHQRQLLDRIVRSQPNATILPITELRVPYPAPTPHKLIVVFDTTGLHGFHGFFGDTQWSYNERFGHYCGIMRRSTNALLQTITTGLSTVQTHDETRPGIFVPTPTGPATQEYKLTFGDGSTETIVFEYRQPTPPYLGLERFYRIAPDHIRTTHHDTELLVPVCCLFAATPLISMRSAQQPELVRGEAPIQFAEALYLLQRTAVPGIAPVLKEQLTTRLLADFRYTMDAFAKQLRWRFPSSDSQSIQKLTTLRSWIQASASPSESATYIHLINQYISAHPVQSPPEISSDRATYTPITTGSELTHSVPLLAPPSSHQSPEPPETVCQLVLGTHSESTEKKQPPANSPKSSASTHRRDKSATVTRQRVPASTADDPLREELCRRCGIDRLPDGVSKKFMSHFPLLLAGIPDDIETGTPFLMALAHTALAHGDRLDTDTAGAIVSLIEPSVGDNRDAWTPLAIHLLDILPSELQRLSAIPKGKEHDKIGFTQVYRKWFEILSPVSKTIEFSEQFELGKLRLDAQLMGSKKSQLTVTSLRHRLLETSVAAMAGQPEFAEFLVKKSIPTAPKIDDMRFLQSLAQRISVTEDPGSLGHQVFVTFTALIAESLRGAFQADQLTEIARMSLTCEPLPAHRDELVVRLLTQALQIGEGTEAPLSPLTLQSLLQSLQYSPKFPQSATDDLLPHLLPYLETHTDFPDSESLLGRFKGTISIDSSLYFRWAILLTERRIEALGKLDRTGHYYPPQNETWRLLADTPIHTLGENDAYRFIMATLSICNSHGTDPRLNHTLYTNSMRMLPIMTSVDSSLMSLALRLTYAESNGGSTHTTDAIEQIYGELISIADPTIEHRELIQSAINLIHTMNPHYFTDIQSVLDTHFSPFETTLPSSIEGKLQLLLTSINTPNGSANPALSIPDARAQIRDLIQRLPTDTIDRAVLHADVMLNELQHTIIQELSVDDLIRTQERAITPLMAFFEPAKHTPKMSPHQIALAHLIISWHTQRMVEYERIDPRQSIQFADNGIRAFSEIHGKLTDHALASFRQMVFYRGSYELKQLIDLPHDDTTVKQLTDGSDRITRLIKKLIPGDSIEHRILLNLFKFHIRSLALNKPLEELRNLVVSDPTRAIQKKLEQMETAISVLESTQGVIEHFNAAPSMALQKPILLIYPQLHRTLDYIRWIIQQFEQDFGSKAPTVAMPHEKLDYFLALSRQLRSQSLAALNGRKPALTKLKAGFNQLDDGIIKLSKLLQTISHTIPAFLGTLMELKCHIFDQTKSQKSIHDIGNVANLNLFFGLLPSITESARDTLEQLTDEIINTLYINVQHDDLERLFDIYILSNGVKFKADSSLIDGAGSPSIGWELTNSHSKIHRRIDAFVDDTLSRLDGVHLDADGRLSDRDEAVLIDAQHIFGQLVLNMLMHTDYKSSENLSGRRVERYGMQLFTTLPDRLLDNELVVSFCHLLMWRAIDHSCPSDHKPVLLDQVMRLFSTLNRSTQVHGITYRRASEKNRIVRLLTELGHFLATDALSPSYSEQLSPIIRNLLARAVAVADPTTDGPR